MSTRSTRLGFVLVVMLSRVAHAAPAPAGAIDKEPTITRTAKPGGVTEIAIAPTDGGKPVTYCLDLSKHFRPAREKTPALAAWEAYRLGAFVCFGSNQFTGSEHCQARDPKVYNPASLDVSGWIAAFKQAGMKYAVLTARHTSQFLLWDSATTTCDVAASGNPTDVVRAFVEACRREGIAPGLYYCMWGGAKYNPHPQARAIILAQLYELATRYGPIPYFWIDMMNWAPSDLAAQEVYDALKGLQPGAIVLVNQHVQDGTKLAYFPTDVLNGELVPPPPEGHNPWRKVEGTTCYLPFEFEPCSQRREGGISYDPLGPSCWFTYGEGKPFAPSHAFPAEALHRRIRLAYDRGAANVLLATAPDYTGRMRAADVTELARLGKMLAQPAPAAVLSLDLKGCPEGAVLQWPDVPAKRRPASPPNPEVDKFFRGWTAALSGWMGTPSCLEVVHEQGQAMVANRPYGANGYQSRVLLGGQMTWQDYSTEATVRLVGREPSQAFGEHLTVPFVGVLARYQDLNRYYLWALQPSGAVLYRRHNSDWIKLGQAGFEVAPDRFFTLRLSVRGNRLEGEVDGRPLVAVQDESYPDGKAGVRFNTDVRVRSIAVTMDQAEIARSTQLHWRQQQELEEVRKSYARPTIYKTLDVPRIVPGMTSYVCRPGHLLDRTKWQMVLSGSGKTAAIDLEGRLLWEIPLSLQNVALGEPDARGVSRIVGLCGRKLLMFDGRTGKQLAEGSAPAPPLHYGPWRLGNLNGNGQLHYAARTGDSSPEVIVYDESLRELFRHKVSIEMGHTFGLGFWDVDGDGREELLAGGSLLRGSGRPVWQSRATETHLDQVALGPLGPRGRPVAVFLGVDEGVFFVDGLTGRPLVCVDVGHSQGIVVGNFRPEVEGLEALVMDRWGAFGVTSLLSGTGQLIRQWMLLPEEYYCLHLPVSWRGDGGELIMVSRKFEPPTLLDGYGCEIFRLPVEPGYYTPYTHLFPLDVVGDCREEILAVEKSGKITIFTQEGPGAKDVHPDLPPVKWMLMSVPRSSLRPTRPNLLRNGGFEEVAADGKPAAWQAIGKASVLGGLSVACQGEHAARVRFTDGMAQEFEVKPETRYEVLGFVRHEQPGVEPARLKILFKDAQGRLVGSEAFRIFELSSVEYRPFRFEMTTPPSAARCNLLILGRFTGSEWMLYDEVSVRELGP